MNLIYNKIVSSEKNKPGFIKPGITYNSDGTINLCVCACSKTTPAKSVWLVGDFNHFIPDEDDLFYRDGSFFWLKTNKITIGDSFQYMVITDKNVIKYISDPYSRKVEVSTNYGRYKTILTEPDKILNNNFIKPDKNNLIIYEIWVDWFAKNHMLTGVIDKIDYLIDLGINTIELMPVLQTSGISEWGYDPGHYFVINENYGTLNDLIKLVDICHENGIAVILDVVFNHATSFNPMNYLYKRNDNPWLTKECPHKPDDFFEDWNYGFQPLKDMVKSCLSYWMDVTGVDGYRIDLAHGLCDENGNGSVDFLIECYNEIILPRKGFFTVEFFNDSITDVKTLEENGIMCWSNCTSQYQQIAMGWTENSSVKELNKKNYVGCSENHDNEHMFFKMKQWGNNINNYNRTQLLGFQMMLSGPQLFYNFTETGYFNSFYQDETLKWGIEANQYGITPDLPYSTKMKRKKYVNTLPDLNLKKAINFRKNNPEYFSKENILKENGFIKTVEYPDVFAAINFSGNEQIKIDIPYGNFIIGDSNVLKPGELIILKKETPKLRLLSDDEWDYILNKRVNADKLKFWTNSSLSGLYIAQDEYNGDWCDASWECVEKMIGLHEDWIFLQKENDSPTTYITSNMHKLVLDDNIVIIEKEYINKGFCRYAFEDKFGKYSISPTKKINFVKYNFVNGDKKIHKYDIGDMLIINEKMNKK